MKPAAPKSPERQDAVRKSFGLEAKSDPTAVPEMGSATDPNSGGTIEPEDSMDSGGAEAIMNDPNAMQAIDMLSQSGYTSDDVKQAMDSMQQQPMPSDHDGDENAL